MKSFLLSTKITFFLYYIILIDNSFWYEGGKRWQKNIDEKKREKERNYFLRCWCWCWWWCPQDPKMRWQRCLCVCVCVYLCVCVWVGVCVCVCVCKPLTLTPFYHRLTKTQNETGGWKPENLEEGKMNVKWPHHHYRSIKCTTQSTIIYFKGKQNVVARCKIDLNLNAKHCISFQKF